MAATTATAALSMKLLIDPKARRVLFAEASKEVVDSLFSLLTLPVATIGKYAMVGSVGNLYASVGNLNPNSSLFAPKTLYRCASSSSRGYTSSCRTYITDVIGKACPNCHCMMTTAVSYLGASGSGKVVAQSAAGVAAYTVLDDLTVRPTSAISSINLLNTFAVRDLGDLQEKTVQLGHKECLAILKASLQSKTVLTDVFLHGGNKASAGGGA